MDDKKGGVERGFQSRHTKCNTSFESQVESPNPLKCDCDWGTCFCVELNRQWEFAKLRTRFSEICSLLQQSRSQCDPCEDDEAFSTSFLVSAVAHCTFATETKSQSTTNADMKGIYPFSGQCGNEAPYVCGSTGNGLCSCSQASTTIVGKTSNQKPGRKRKMPLHAASMHREQYDSSDRSCIATNAYHLDAADDLFQPRECFVRWVMERRSMCKYTHLDPLIPSPLPLPFFRMGCHAGDDSREQGVICPITSSHYSKDPAAEGDKHSQHLLVVKAMEQKMLDRLRRLTSSQLLDEFGELLRHLSVDKCVNFNSCRSDGPDSSSEVFESTEQATRCMSESDIHTCGVEKKATGKNDCPNTRADVFSWFALISAASKLPMSMIEDSIFSASLLRELQDEYPASIFGQKRISTCAAAESFAIRVAEMIILQYEMQRSRDTPGTNDVQGRISLSQDSNKYTHRNVGFTFNLQANQKLLLPAGCCPSPDAVKLESLVQCLNDLLSLLGAEKTHSCAEDFKNSTQEKCHRILGRCVTSCREAYGVFVTAAKPCLMQIRYLLQQQSHQLMLQRMHSTKQNDGYLESSGEGEFVVRTFGKAQKAEGRNAHSMSVDLRRSNGNNAHVQLSTYLPLLKWPSLHSCFRETYESSEVSVKTTKSTDKTETSVVAFQRGHAQWLLYMLRPVTWTFYGFYLLLTSAALTVCSFAAARAAMAYSYHHTVAAKAPLVVKENYESCFLKHFLAQCPRVRMAATSVTGASLPSSFGKTPDLSNAVAHVMGPSAWALAWIRGRRFECLTLKGGVDFLEELKQDGPSEAVALVQTRFFIKATTLYHLWKRFLHQRRRSGKCSLCCGGCFRNEDRIAAFHCNNCTYESPSTGHATEVVLGGFGRDEVPSGAYKECTCSETHETLRPCQCSRKALDLLFNVVRSNVLSPVSKCPSAQQPAFREAESQSVHVRQPSLCPCLVELFISKVYTLLCRSFCVCGLAREGRGLSCSVPAPVLFSLKRDLGGEILEGFASPLNARTLRFCSAFYDIDKDFGSSGSFFEQSQVNRENRHNAFVTFLNPPFEETLIKRMEARIIQTLDENSTEGQDLDSQVPLVFVVCLPDWSATVRNVGGNCTKEIETNESEMHNSQRFASKLLTSRYLHSITLMEAEAHFYTSGYSHFCGPYFQSVRSPCSSVLCLLLNECAKRRLKVHPDDVLKNAAHAWMQFSKGVMQSHKLTE